MKTRPRNDWPESAAAETISRIDWELTFGCFEINHADGGIRFRTIIALTGNDITPGLIAHLIHSNLCIVDERISQTMAVLNGKKSPATVMKPKPSAPKKAKTKSQTPFALN